MSWSNDGDGVTRNLRDMQAKIRIGLESLRGKQSVSGLCHRESLAASLFDRSSEESCGAV